MKQVAWHSSRQLRGQLKSRRPTLSFFPLEIDFQVLESRCSQGQVLCGTNTIDTRFHSPPAESSAWSTVNRSSEVSGPKLGC